MMRTTFHVSIALLGALAASCSSGSGRGSSGFEVVSVSVSNGQTWQINRAIEVSFSEPPDLSSVDFTTFQIRTARSQPAVGTLRLKPGDPNTVVFQPKCPTRDDFSDAGLLPNGTSYTLTVVGSDTGAGNHIMSKDKVALRRTQVRTFTTPFSLNPGSIFIDLRPTSPPAPVVRQVGSGITQASFIEVGGDTTRRVYFASDPSKPVSEQFTLETDPATDPGFDPLTSGLPLNLYSDGSSRVAVVLEFDQPVNPVSTNINSSRLGLEFLDGAGEWQPVDTRVTLVANCTETGARVRLEPVGILPEGGMVRAVVRPGFLDVAGNGVLDELNTFGAFPTNQSNFANLTPPEGKSDEFLEEFLVGGTASTSFHDSEALFSAAPALWGSGKLEAGFSFASSSGAPTGKFDVVVDPGETLAFNTVRSEVIGGENGVPTSTQIAVGGVLEVRNLIIRQGGVMTLSGPNPFRLNATGYVRIEGILDGSGQDAQDVSTLGTGHLPSIGGAGELGGGNGGRASIVTNSSTPRGERGRGAYNEDSPSGGEGGESGYARGQKDNRRPGGGGGGAFGPVGQIPTDGQDGNKAALGAEGGDPIAMEAWPQGGRAGSYPFLDTRNDNDFFGVGVKLSGMVEVLTLGELPSLFGGSGGGGGGDAVPGSNFPAPNWDPGSDEKGGGGGGAGGAINIRALGPIIFGSAGQIRSKGGRGAIGENTNFVDHVGGSGGGGSGGHVVLETASFVDFTDGATNQANSGIMVDTRGGVGGDPFNLGGGSGTVSGGGRGGIGILQVHVPEPLKPAGIFTNPAAPPDSNIYVNAAQNSGNYTAPPALVLVPMFGARSLARSKWISIGAADQDPAGAAKPLEFRFEGTDPQGFIETTNGVVNELAPVLDGGFADAGVSVPGTNSVLFQGAALEDVILSAPENDIYLRTPSLLRNFVLRISSTAVAGLKREFLVASAEYSDSAGSLAVTVADNPFGTLKDFVDGIGVSNADYSLIPRFFRVVRNGIESALPDTTFVKIEFQATGVNAGGDPDESNIVVDWTGDIEQFNLVTPGEIKFFRFRVEFDLDAMGNGLTIQTRPIQLDYLRIPFRF